MVEKKLRRNDRAKPFQLSLELIQPGVDVSLGRLLRKYGNPILIEKRFDQCVGITYDGLGDSLVQLAIESQDGGHGVAGRQGRDKIGKVPDQELAKVLDLFHYF